MKDPMFLSLLNTGRPRAVELTREQARRLCELYLRTNRTRREGSMEVAWVLLAEETGLWPWTVAHHRLVGALPTAAVEVMRRAKGLVTTHRRGAKELRINGPHQQGGMRSYWGDDRRLRAGESFSVDDLTRNVGVIIPWPHGGCPCSEKFGVRLGRWQTLAVADDATGAVVAVSSVFRWASSYQGVDAASLIFQTERNVGMAGFSAGDSRWVVEGGVWQSKHALAALGGRFYSAKGRPGQKLIERWFGAMQTYDAVWNRDLGRQRGENLEANKLWLECRAGKRDPRGIFPGFEEGQESLQRLIRYMNEREVRSDGLYGRWVPQERWERDVAEHGLVRRSAEDAWVMMPERRSLMVSRRAQLSCSAVLADGVNRKLVWNGAFLYGHTGRTLDLYFDPMGEYPITGVVVEPRTRRVLGEVVCQASFGQSRDEDRERLAAIRRTMLTDLRVMMGTNAGMRRTEARGLGGSLAVERAGAADAAAASDDFDRSEGDHLAGRGKNHRAHDAAAVPEPRQPTVAVENLSDGAVAREGSVLVSRTTRGAIGAIFQGAGSRTASAHDGPGTGPLDVSGGTFASLSRRAREAAAEVPNF